MGRKKTASMEERIEQFCKSSGELLAGINAKYGSDSKLKRKRKKTDLTTMMETDADLQDDELLKGQL